VTDQLPPLKLLFFWRAMGPYHAARMRALGSRSNVRLSVIERFDHGDPERSWPTVRESLGATVTTLDWKNALSQPVEHWRSFDAVIVPGWYERDFLTFLHRLPGNQAGGPLRVVYSVSTAQDRPRVAWREWMKRRRLARFDAALAAGERSADYLAHLGMPSGRVAIVGNVADPEPFEAAYRRRREGQAPPMSGAYLLYAGRLAPEKNLPALLQAFSTLARATNFAQWSLVLAGHGTQESTLRAGLPDDVRDRVRFLGETSYQELAVWMTHARALVLPSLREPWGLVVNEAYHAGRPVIVTPVCGCVPELAHPSASWVTRDAHRASIEATLRVALPELSSIERANAMGEAGHRLVSMRFTPEHFADATASAIARLLSTGGLPPRRGWMERLSLSATRPKRRAEASHVRLVDAT